MRLYAPEQAADLAVRDEQFNLADYLLRAKDDPRTALVTLKGEFTRRDLRTACLGVARYLRDQGLKKGDRVLLMAENSFYWVSCYLGILKAGQVCAPLAPDLSEAELEHVLASTEANHAFVQLSNLPRFTRHLRPSQLTVDCSSTNSAVRDFSRILGMSSEEALHSHTEATDLAALMFTSGSTGTPRGVMISHGNIHANTESIIEYISLTESDRVLAVLPFHYCFGTSLLHTHLRAGASLVLGSRFLYPENVLQRMEETRCTGFAGVPSHFQILLKRSSLKKKSFPYLRWVQQAGGHLAPALVQELKESLPNTRVFVMYGQTEATARLSYLPPEFLTVKPGSIGKGIPGVHLSVERGDGTPVGPGEVGEIVAQGENIASGYWRDPDETAMTFRDRRLHTGDLATVDADGFISIVGRAGDFLKCGGKRVSCKQLEDNLLACSELLEAAVLGMPDDALGEAIVAFIVPRQPIPGIETRVLDFCRRSLPFQLVPKHVVAVESLPKNAAGKVLKQQLKEQLRNESCPQSTVPPTGPDRCQADF